MERYDEGSGVEVQAPRTGGIVALVLLVIFIIVVLIIIIILLRRKNGSGTTSTGSGSTQCATDFDCSGNQICNTANGTCVNCIDNSNCPVNNPICNTTTNTCVTCLSPADCPHATPLCDTNTNQCVQCNSSADCGGGTPHCSPTTQRCVGCTSGGDCPLSAPICSAANSTCVQCQSNANCTSPATCVGGTCCDLTPPTINALTCISQTSGYGEFVGTYTTTQSLTGATAVFEVADSTGFVLYTTAGTPANGTINVAQTNQNAVPSYYAGYTYQVRVRLILPCGATALSSPASASVPYPASYNLPIIDHCDVSTTTLKVYLSQPNYTFLIFYQANIIISAGTQPTLDPNRSIIDTNVFDSSANPYLTFTINWPFGVSSGQQYNIRAVGVFGSDSIVASTSFLVTIP